ncbi:hypothetical protein ACIQF3_26670 [Bacillus thuringiensis]|uniref:hypothetical protein n=1 Tax=Bacillus thuringiensis TaxID=1428 RepID=UPI002FFDD163
MSIKDEYHGFVNLLEDYKIKHGEFSNATLIVKLSILIFVLEHIELENDEYRINLLEDIISHYNNAPQPATTRSPVIIENNGENLFVFIPDVDNQPYNRYRNEVKPFIINVDNPINIENNKWYMYVVTIDNKFLILDSPLTTVELITGRNSILLENIQPQHPHLLCDYEELKVKSAGELLFVTEKENNNIQILINNKSGHFKPDISSLDNAALTLSGILKISEKQIHKIPMDFAAVLNR